MKFFFDNNLPAQFAHAMGALSKNLEHVDAVVHLSDRFARNADDLDWIPALTADGPWAVVSRDRFKKQSGAERAALRAAGHTVFFLAPQWQRHGYWAEAERLVRWWPQIVKQASMVSGGAFVVPWQTSSRFAAVKL